MTNTHKIVLGNKREIDIPIDKLKSFENNQVESKIVYSTMDKELWERRNGKLTQKDYNRCDKTISQFFTEYYKVQNQQDKRKKDVMFGALYNSDASPIKREDRRGKEPDELTIAIRMIVLSALNNKKISTHNMTLFDWLREFYIINNGFYTDYKTDRNNTYKYNLLEYIDKSDYPFDIDSLTKQEKHKMVKQYYNNIVELLKNKLHVTLRKFESDGLIYLQTYMVGVKKGKHYEPYLLSPKELNKLKELELDIKEKMNLHHLIGKRLHTHEGFKQELNKRLLEEGLKTEETHNHFKFVYNTYSISKAFTDVQLNNYINQNTYISKAIKIEPNEFIHTYQNLLNEAISNKYDRASERYKSDITYKYTSETIGNLESIKALIANKHNMIDTYNQQNKQFSKMMLSQRHGDNLSKLFNVQVEETTSTNDNTFELNEKDLPF